MSLQREDKNLVDQARKGSQEAFRQLIEENQTKIYNLAYRLTGNPQDALDVSQEAFFKAWQALPNFKGDSSFSTWLYRLTSNCAIDLLRKQKRRPESSLTMTYDQEEESTQLDIPDSRFTPHQTFDQKELSDTIQKGLDLLPQHQKEVLIMREIQGLSYQEIATALDLDLGTVKSRIARGRLTLRTFLTKENMTPE